MPPIIGIGIFSAVAVPWFISSSGYEEFVKNRAGGPPVTDGRHVRFAHRQPIFEHTGIPQLISGLQSKPPLIEWWNSSCLKREVVPLRAK